MKKIITLLLLMALAVMAAGPLTRAEWSNFKETSSYEDVMNFLWALKKGSERIQIRFFARSYEGRKIPLVIVSTEGIKTPEQARSFGKEVILINANIHAGEVEGKEASLMLIRELVQGKHDELLRNQVVLFIPIFNPDGNEKMAKGNRRDNGPEKAGVRYNGQGLDLNRDFIKQESPEVKGLVAVLRKWDPVLFVDMHTTDGSYHRHVVTWMPQIAPWTDPEIMDYSFSKMFSEINAYMKKEGYDAIPHGGFTDRKDPSKGWTFWAVLARYGVNYVGLRNRFAILDENYSRADFRSRVYGALALLKSILKFTARNGKEMREIVRAADRRASAELAGSSFGVEFEDKEFFEFDLKSYKFRIRKIPESERSKYPPWFGGFLVEKTDEPALYRLKLIAPVKVKKSVLLPAEGYIILPCAKDVVKILLRNGIAVSRLLADVEMEVEEFRLEEVQSTSRPYQGHHLKTLKGRYEKVRKVIPAGSFFVSLHQPLSRLAAVMLEPTSPDGFAAWGLFDRVLFHQWSRRPWMIPVLRVNQPPAVERLLLSR